MSYIEILANKYSRSVIMRSRKQDFEMSRVDCNSLTFIPQLTSCILHISHNAQSHQQSLYMYVNLRKTSQALSSYPDTGGTGVLPRKIFILKIACGAFWRISEHFLSTKQILQTNNIYISLSILTFQTLYLPGMVLSQSVDEMFRHTSDIRRIFHLLGHDLLLCILAQANLTLNV